MWVSRGLNSGIFAVPSLLAIALLYVGFNIQYADFVYGGVLNGEEWKKVPIYYLTVVGILYVIIPAVLVVGILTNDIHVLVSGPVVAIAFLEVGFNIHYTHTSHFRQILDKVEGTNLIVPIDVFIFVDFLPAIIHPLFLLTKNDGVLILYIPVMVLIVVLEIIALIFLSEVDIIGLVVYAMRTSMGKYYNPNVLDSYRSVSFKFWDNLQTDFQCCGRFGPSDWVDATGAPTVGFVPTSCCLAHFKSNETCTQQITEENVKDLDFISEIIYTKDCISEFNRYYSTKYLRDWVKAIRDFQPLYFFL